MASRPVYDDVPIQALPVTALRHPRGNPLSQLSEEEKRRLRRSVLWAYRLLLARGRRKKAQAVEEKHRSGFLAVFPTELRGFVANVPRGNSIRCLVIPGVDWYEVQDWQQFCEYAGNHLAEITDTVTVRMDGPTFARVQEFVAGQAEGFEVRSAAADLEAIERLVAEGSLPAQPMDVVKKSTSTQVRLEWGETPKNPA